MAESRLSGRGANRALLTKDLDGNALHANAEYVANPQDVGSLGQNIATSGFSSVSTSEVELTAGIDRRVVAILNNGNVELFVGPSGVDTANMYPVPTGQQISFNATSGIRIYGKTAGGSTDVRIVELA